MKAVRWALLLLAGCGGDAQMELTAADAIDAVAGQMAVTIDEYHRDVSRSDDAREAGAVAAFVARVRADAADDAAVATHIEQFEAALRKIRADRETEWTRRNAVMENVGVLREVSKGMQRLAIQSLGLRDEMRRYLEGWIAARRRADDAGGRDVR